MLDSDYNEASDPVGREEDRDRLRALGKWRFILTRGLIIAGPIFLLLFARDLLTDIREAQRLHQPILQHLFQTWVFKLLLAGGICAVVGFFAWSRLVSDYWPGRDPDNEAAHTRLGSLAKRN